MEDSKVTRILEAARNRFAHYGLSKTTMNEIAADIGMSKASLYYYFPDKERLFIAVVEKEFFVFETAIRDLLGRTSKASFKLKKYVSLRYAFLQELGNLSKIEATNVAEVVNPVYNELKTELFNREKELVQLILESGVESGEFTRLPLAEYADFFVTTMVGLRSAGFLLPDRDQTVFMEKIHRHMRLFSDMFLTSIRP